MPKTIEEEYTYRLEHTRTLLETFPKAKNGLSYLRMIHGKRVFFSVFFKKYHLDGSPFRSHQKRYTKKDLIGRMKLIPLFPDFFRYATMVEHDRRNNRRILESKDIKAIIIQYSKKNSSKTRYELLSFFPYKKKNAPV